MVQTMVPGRKVMVEFDPADSDKIDSFEITVTPYCKFSVFFAIFKCYILIPNLDGGKNVTNFLLAFDNCHLSEAITAL